MARSVVEAQRGKHPTHVFNFKGKTVNRMLTTGWRNARKKAGRAVRLHHLRHTFGRRLRSAGVGPEDRQDLLGHRSRQITTHYSSTELQNFYEAANKACEARQNGLALTLLRCYANEERVRVIQNA